MKRIPRAVFILGLVSFFNDTASEMVYPLVPLFLTTVLHTSVPILGLIEGVAESTASITKYFFGLYSDRLQKRKPFVVAGYSFGAVSKLLIALSYTWPLVLFARFIDRLGKGLRTAPRDSILLENTTEKNRGFIFGFHRAFDSLGAVVGPLIALGVLAYFHNNIREAFFIAFIPGICAVLLLIIFIREKKNHTDSASPQKVSFHWKSLDKSLQFFLLISFIFALGNSSDSFLLLRSANLGLSAALVVAVYVLYNVSQTIFATPLGQVSDRIGPKKVFIGGLLVFALVYFFFGFIHSSIWLWVLFPIYGIYIAATDGVSKAYVATFIQKSESGTYFGAYYTLTAIGNLVASLAAGMLWTFVHPSAVFYFGSIFALFAAVLLWFFHPKSAV